MSTWRTREEREAAQKAQRFAMLLAMKERDARKPARKTHYDGEIAKRRDRS